MRILQLPYSANSEFLFSKISHLNGCVWLDSGKPLSPMGRYDILSALPTRTIECAIENVEAQVTPNLMRQENQSELPFSGGWIGYLPYEGVCHFAWYDWAVVVDHELQASTLFFLEECSQATKQFIEQCLKRPEQTETDSFNCSRFKADITQEQYVDSINTIQDYLRAGDCYQVNYTQRFSAEFSGDTSAAYTQLREAVPSPFSAYIKTQSGAILSISPERFIQIIGKDALTQPIKGTIQRGNTDEFDQDQKETLRHSEKNLAENVMIVDLLRNDFNRSCEPFSVKVPHLFEVQSFANVHHLVSTIVGRLRSHITHIDFIQTCFPGGSITGAPKKRAMEIIAELEPFSREIYCGAIGYLSCNQKSDFNIAIRTLQVIDDKIFAWAGGGIVLDSDPQQEYQESLDKIERLLHAVETL